jgi:hypothetical protein
VLSRRLFTCVIAAAVCLGASLSFGSGIAAAGPPLEFLAGIAGKMGLLVEDTKTAWSLTRIGRPDIPEAKQMTEYENFANSVKPLRPRGAADGSENKAARWVCDSALTLFQHADQYTWDKARDDLRTQVMKLAPGGETLALANELVGVAGQYLSGCICAATAHLEVLYAQDRLCKALAA